ncbi:MAG: mechanosensitive ion channel family protein [Planctomycetota bacterium]
MQLPFVLAQADPPSTQANPSSAADGPPAIEINPDEVPGIDIVTGEAETPEPEVQGALAEKLDEVVPDTGYASVDGAVNTLTDAVGNLVEGFFTSLPQLLIAVCVLIATALIARFADYVANRLLKRARVRESLRDLFRIFIRTAVWFAGIFVAAIIVFPTFGVGQLVAAAGLTSIALGFAFQDIFENFFAGILILWRFPFENGDFIEVDGLMGRVEDVEIRMTHIRKTNGELVLVPNSMIFKNKVTVQTNRPNVRMELAVGIAYGEDIAEGRKVILEAVKSCDTVQQTVKPEVLATAFGASSIDFDVIWWAASRPIEARRSRDQVVEAIKKALDDAGIEIPYPYRTLTFSKNEPDIIHAVAGRMDQDRGGSEGDSGVVEG